MDFIKEVGFKLTPKVGDNFVFPQDLVEDTSTDSDAGEVKICTINKRKGAHYFWVWGVFVHLLRQKGVHIKRWLQY